MRISVLRRVLPAVLALSGAAIAPQAAHAATSFTITSVGIDPTPGGLQGTVYFAGLGNGSGHEDGGIGRILLTGKDASNATVTFESYCVDLFDFLAPGTFVAAPLSTMNLSTTKLQELTTYLAHADGLVNQAGATAAMSAAAQLGAWEIINETGSTYDVTSGAFYAAGGNLAGTGYDSRALANTWLGQVKSGAWQPVSGAAINLLEPGNGNQAQVYTSYSSASPSSPGSVPEPASWALMLVGFGAVGAALRRTRTTSVAFKPF